MASIEERVRADGGSSYRVRWRLGGSRAGAQQTETFTSRARAMAFKEDVEEAGHQWPKGWIKGEGYLPRAALGPTFADVAEDYFAEQRRRVQRGRLKEYTVHRYRRIFELQLRPAFGEMPFTALDHDEIADWIDTKIDGGDKPKTVRNQHGVLFSIMSHGQKRMRLRGDNPCETSELPTDDAWESRQVRFLLPEEWALFRSCLAEDVQLLVDVLLATGMRWGEVSALRAGDLSLPEPDEDAVVINIVRAWSRRAPDDRDQIASQEGENKSWKLGPPKNRRARYVVVTGDVARRLHEAAAQKSAHEYVFTTRRGNPWRHADFHADRWLPARADARRRGLTKTVTPHMLRHTAVVWSLAANIPIQVISEMLGHASIQITYDVYGGLIDLRDPTMAKAMAESMKLVRTAIVPSPTTAEVAARRIRPGPRGSKRPRVT